MHRGRVHTRALLEAYELPFAQAAIDFGADAVIGHHEHICGASSFIAASRYSTTTGASSRAPRRGLPVRQAIDPVGGPARSQRRLWKHRQTGPSRKERPAIDLWHCPYRRQLNEPALAGSPPS